MVLEPPRTYAVVGPRPSDGKIRGKAASEDRVEKLLEVIADLQTPSLSSASGVAPLSQGDDSQTAAQLANFSLLDTDPDIRTG